MTREQKIELVEKVLTLKSKADMTASGIIMAQADLTEEQYVRLNEQVDSVLDDFDKFITNLLKVEEVYDK